MKKPWTDRFGDFMAGKGFYIVLVLCVAAIGASGFYLFSSLAGDNANTPVVGPAQVIATPPTTPSVAPTATASPAPSPVKPSTNPTPSPKPSVSPNTSAAPSTSPAPNTPNAPNVPNAPTVFTWPVKGQVVDAFSPDRQRYDVTMEDWRTHEGIDVAADVGAQVKAAAKGTVSSVRVDDLLGTTVTIDHGSGLKSVYANLGELPTVSEGDTVSAGDVIGAVGTTAMGESVQVPHLHLAFYKDDVPADPFKYLPNNQ